MMKLLSATPSPYARKVRIALAEKARDEFTLADVAVGSLLRWLDVRAEDIPWRRLHPKLAALSDRLEVRPSFRDTVPFAQTFRDKVV